MNAEKGRSTTFQRLPSLDQVSLNVVAQSSECSPSGPPSLSSILMSPPAVGLAGRVGWEAYQASRMPRNELQS